MNINLSISTENYGGFKVHNWLLHYENNGVSKDFWLGQDAKFCSRVLGLSPSYIVQCIGDNNLDNEDTRTKLAWFIVNELGLTEQQLAGLEPWELACQ